MQSVINMYREHRYPISIQVSKLDEAAQQCAGIEAAAERDNVARRLSGLCFKLGEPRSENRGPEGHASLN